MGLRRTFVGFSSTDLHYYRQMQAWKADTNIDFNFADLQLHKAINSNDERYIKRFVRDRITMAGKYALLIGEDTRYKYKYVRWEAEVAIEKNCTIIGINLDRKRKVFRETCPPVIRDIGAIFVAFSPKIVAHAIKNYSMHNDNGNYQYTDSVYKILGY